MDRLSIVLTLVTGFVLVRGLVLILLSMGYYHWQSIAGAVAVGLILAWPFACAISRKFKHDDPRWRVQGAAQRKRAHESMGFRET